MVRKTISKSIRKSILNYKKKLTREGLIFAHPISSANFLNPVSPFVMEIKKYGILV